MKGKIIIIHKRFIYVGSRSYQSPVNRWKYHYSNGDGFFEQELTYYERMNLPQPLTEEYSHKLRPDYHWPNHLDNFRYDFNIKNWPRRHFVSTYRTKLYNNHDFYSLMHGNEWPDLQPDFQIEEPMSSNHYIQHGGHLRALYFVVFCIIFMFSNFLKYSFCFSWIRYYGFP